MGTNKERQNDPVEVELTPSRRQALARLGFATAVAYAAPTILHLDRSAKATVEPSCTNPDGGGNPDPSCNGLSPFNGDPTATGGAEPPPVQ